MAARAEPLSSNFPLGTTDSINHAAAADAEASRSVSEPAADPCPPHESAELHAPPAVPGSHATPPKHHEYSNNDMPTAYGEDAAHGYVKAGSTPAAPPAAAP
jgi:hypothetical protein